MTCFAVELGGALTRETVQAPCTRPSVLTRLVHAVICKRYERCLQPNEHLFI